MRDAQLFLVAASLALAGATLPTSSAVDTSVTVLNAAPVVLSVSLSGTVTPTAGGATAVSTTVVVEDVNGHNDISSVTVEVLKPDGATTHVAASAATKTSGALTQGTYTHSFSMQYYDPPALEASTYKVKVTATDSKGATGTNLASLAVFHYTAVAAVGLGSSTLDLGSDLEPGATTSPVALSVLNRGNVQLDLQVSGAALSHSGGSASIPVGNVQYSAASDMTGAAALAESAATLSSFDLAFGSGSSKSLYWRLQVPSGSDQWVPGGTYAGTLSVTGVAG